MKITATKRLTYFLTCMFRFFLTNAKEAVRFYRLQLEAESLRRGLKGFEPLERREQLDFDAEEKRSYEGRLGRYHRLVEIEHLLDPMKGHVENWQTVKLRRQSFAQRFKRTLGDAFHGRGLLPDPWAAPIPAAPDKKENVFLVGGPVDAAPLTREQVLARQNASYGLTKPPESIEQFFARKKAEAPLRLLLRKARGQLAELQAERENVATTKKGVIRTKALKRLDSQIKDLQARIAACPTPQPDFYTDMTGDQAEAVGSVLMRFHSGDGVVEDVVERLSQIEEERKTLSQVRESTTLGVLTDLVDRLEKQTQEALTTAGPQANPKKKARP